MVQDEQNDDGLGGRYRDRKAHTAANRWAHPLAALDDVQLAAIKLPEWILEEVLMARRLVDTYNYLARERSLARVDKLVHELDEAEIWRIDSFLQNPGRANLEHGLRVNHWRQRLIEEGEPAIRAFGEKFPAADLQRLRQVVRNLRKPDPGERPRRQLEELLSIIN